MKLFKSLRLPSAALAAAMLLSSLLALPASADDGGTTATTSLKITGDATLTEGSTGTASVVIENADQVYGIDTYVTIPSNVTVTQIGIKSAFNEDSGFDVTLANNQIHIVGAGSIDRTDTSPVYGSVADELVNYDGTICTFEYTTTVKASDTPNTINFAFPSDTKVRFCTSGEEEVTVSTSGLTVTVKANCTEHNWEYTYNYENKVSTTIAVCKNCAEKKEYSINRPAISGAVVLSSGLAIDFKIAISQLTNFSDYKNYYCVFEKTGYNNDASTETLSTYTLETDSSNITRAVFAYKGIEARQMNNNIFMQAYAVNSDNVAVLIGQVNYSVATYISSQLKKASGKLKDLLIDLAKYGGNAQAYFEYNLENRVDQIDGISSYVSQRDYTLAESDYNKTASRDKTLAVNPGWAAAAKLGNEIIALIRFKKTNIDNLGLDINNLYLVVDYTAADGTQKSVTYNNFEYDSKEEKYYIEFDKIAPVKLKETFTVTMMKNGSEVPLSKLSYCIEAYCYNKRNDSDDSNLATLVKSIATYGRSVAAYVDSLNN